MIQNMAKYLDVKNDYLYFRGREDEKTTFVTNLLTESDLTIEKIAKIAGVAVDFVKSVQRQLTGRYILVDFYSYTFGWRRKAAAINIV